MQATDDLEQLLLDLDSKISRQALFALVYGELKIRAGNILSAHQNPSLSATALVHEMYLKLRDAPLSVRSKGHFFGLASRAMRQIMVDHARHRLYMKRDRRVEVLLEDNFAQENMVLPDMILIDQALGRLSDENAELADIVELHFFAGLSFTDIAQMKKVSLSTIERGWRAAREMLRCLV